MYFEMPSSLLAHESRYPSYWNWNYLAGSMNTAAEQGQERINCIHAIDPEGGVLLCMHACMLCCCSSPAADLRQLATKRLSKNIMNYNVKGG